MEAVGSDRHEEAREVLALGRISWRLRDNDNLLLARAGKPAVARDSRSSREIGESQPPGARGPRERERRGCFDRSLAAAIRRGSYGCPRPRIGEKTIPAAALEETPRQLVGQPAAPGMQTGRVRRIRTAEDLGQFQAGEVLVCDAIQPMMTHLVLLAAAVVERRGGMLIHGAIIARELGLPCVNGVAGAIELLHDGDIVTVDGYLGIVTVGAPEFDLELTDVAGERVSGKSGNVQ